MDADHWLPAVWDEWQSEPEGEWRGAAPMSMSLTAGCEGAVADAFGLEWASFEAAPAELTSPATVPDLVVAGLAELLLGDFGSVADASAAMGPDELLAVEFPAGLPTDDAGAAGSFGLWLFSYVRGRVATITWSPGDDCILEYSDHVVASCLGEYVFDDASERAYLFPPMLAAAFAHEAGHADGPEHMGSTGLDEDCNGTYGLQARVVSRWLAATSESASALDVQAGLRSLEAACNHIRDHSSTGCACSALGD